MKIWELSVKKPIFMSCVLVSLLVVGFFSFKQTPIELFPDVTFPVVVVSTIYPGAGPSEIETLIAQPLEEELSTINGVKNIRSINREGVGIVVAEFNLSTDVSYAEQQVRDKVSSVKARLPDGALEPMIRKVDPSAQPIIEIAISSDISGTQLFDLANDRIRPLFEQVEQVGRVEVLGGRKREIHVKLDRKKLDQRGIPVIGVVAAFQNAGVNLPAGTIDDPGTETVFRTLGEFNSIEQVRRAVVSFAGNEILTTVKDVGQVYDTVEDEKMRAYLNGKQTVFLRIYKQSGANTIAVAGAVHKRVAKINEDLPKELKKAFSLQVVRDQSKFVWANVKDVAESIIIGILLTIIVVYLFLGSARSTFITGLAIPVSLIGCFPLLYLAGVSINVMSLLAFSLAVGLLIDDAIVVRENIFRHMEMGKSAMRAALEGTAEVGMAVTAVTLAILAVFAPIAFLSGVVGQFFKSFGLGVCFIMMVSLFDALSNAPLMSAYFGGNYESLKKFRPRWSHPLKTIAFHFDRFQDWLEEVYAEILTKVLRKPWLSTTIVIGIVLVLASTVKYVPKTFLPPNDSGEFMVAFELPPGTPLEKVDELGKRIDADLRKFKPVEATVLKVGTDTGQSYLGDIYVRLVPFGKRKETTTEMKEQVREFMKKYATALPKVKDVDFVGAGQRPFVVNIRGTDLNQLREVGQKLFEKLKVHPALIDPEITDRPGLPEFQVRIDQDKARTFGVTPTLVGRELRAQIEGITPAQFRDNGREYDIRIRLQDDQRNLEKDYPITLIPNLNGRLVPLKDFTTPVREIGVASINRENRGRYVSIEADIAGKGPGMGGAVADIKGWFEKGDIKLPTGVTYRFVGQAENFQELGVSIMIAGLLAIVFIYLVLASLYESLVTPLTIMLVIPLAIVGGFFGLFIFRSSLDLFSMIGSIMLMGLATKNSIIMVDYINQRLDEGMELKEAIVVGSKTRLRPILMTTFALIAGMIPVAIGLNEASSQRTSLGIAVCSGVLVSTFLTLILIPAVFDSIERGRRYMIRVVGTRIITQQKEDGHIPSKATVGSTISH